MALQMVCESFVFVVRAVAGSMGCCVFFGDVSSGNLLR